MSPLEDLGTDLHRDEKMIIWTGTGSSSLAEGSPHGVLNVHFDGVDENFGP